MVEQHAETVLTLTQDAVVMERGAIVHRAASRELLNDAAALLQDEGRVSGGHLRMRSGVT